jgi:hypothetical protein
MDIAQPSPSSPMEPRLSRASSYIEIVVAAHEDGADTNGELPSLGGVGKSLSQPTSRQDS